MEIAKGSVSSASASENVLERDVGLWVVLNALDLVATVAAREIGLFSELNLLVRLIWHSTTAIILFKVFHVLFVLAFLTEIQKLNLLRKLNIGMAIIVCWNIGWLAVINYLLGGVV